MLGKVEDDLLIDINFSKRSLSPKHRPQLRDSIPLISYPFLLSIPNFIQARHRILFVYTLYIQKNQDELKFGEQQNFAKISPLGYAKPLATV